MHHYTKYRHKLSKKRTNNANTKLTLQVQAVYVYMLMMTSCFWISYQPLKTVQYKRNTETVSETEVISENVTKQIKDLHHKTLNRSCKLQQWLTLCGFFWDMMFHSSR